MQRPRPVTLDGRGASSHTRSAGMEISDLVQQREGLSEGGQAPLSYRREAYVLGKWLVRGEPPVGSDAYAKACVQALIHSP